MIGNMVASQTQGGMVLRSRWRAHGRRTAPQLTHERRMQVVNALWSDLTREECAAWRAYAVTLASRNPQTGGLRIPKAHGLLCGLGTKYLQIHGGTEVPRRPPKGRFMGDVLTVTVEPDGDLIPTTLEDPRHRLTFAADGTNREGVLTELLGQMLTGPNNLPKRKSYVSLGFVAFEAGTPVELPVSLGGWYACAARFVETSSGRMTDLVEIGTGRTS